MNDLQTAQFERLDRIAEALELIASVLVNETKIGGALNVQDLRRVLAK